MEEEAVYALKYICSLFIQEVINQAGIFFNIWVTLMLHLWFWGFTDVAFVPSAALIIFVMSLVLH
jgi:hypothetical protein